MIAGDCIAGVLDAADRSLTQRDTDRTLPRSHSCASLFDNVAEGRIRAMGPSVAVLTIPSRWANSLLRLHGESAMRESGTNSRWPRPREPWPNDVEHITEQTSTMSQNVTLPRDFAGATAPRSGESQRDGPDCHRGLRGLKSQSHARILELSGR
jgi:hypothetical protein